MYPTGSTYLPQCKTKTVSFPSTSYIPHDFPKDKQIEFLSYQNERIAFDKTLSDERYTKL